MKKPLFIPLIFIISFISSLFIMFIIKESLRECTSLYFPINLEELKALCYKLKNCYNNHELSIHLFHMICFLFLQTWCIPGTILFNLFGGAIFGVYKGFICCLVFNTLGAFIAYSLSSWFLKEFFEMNDSLKKKKDQMKEKIEENKDNLIYYMIFLRLFPGTPNWLMNLSFPHLNINKLNFILSVFIGLAPWNFFSCSAGSILFELTDTKQIMDNKKYAFLIILALCILLIPTIKKKFSSNYKTLNNNKDVEC